MNIGQTNVNVANKQAVSGRTPVKQGINTRDVFTPSADSSAPSFRNIPRTLSGNKAGNILFREADGEKSTQISMVEKPQWRSSGGISSASGLSFNRENNCLYGGINVIEEVFDTGNPMEFLHQHTLTCFNTDGSVRWQFDGPDCMGGPVCDKKGNIYITSESTVWAFNKDGKVNWRAGLSDLFSLDAQPVVSPEGTVFAVNKDDGKKNAEIKINAIKDGKVKWTYRTDYWNSKNNSMLSGKDGSLYVAGAIKTADKGFFAGPPETRNYFIGLKSNGTEKFRIPVKNWGETNKGCLTEGPDGTIYTIQEGGKLVAYTPEGREKFGKILMGHRKNSSFPLTADFPPAIDKDGNLYIATKGFQTNNLICFDKDGNEKWRTGVEKEFTTQPNFMPDGNIIVGFKGGNMQILNKDGEIHKKYLVKSGRNDTPDDSGDGDHVPIDVLDMTCDEKGQIYAGTSNWVLSYDLYTDSPEQTVDKQEASGSGNYSISAEEETVTIGGVMLKKNRSDK